MQIVISDPQEPISDALRAFAHRRLQFALSRFAPRIQQVTIVLNDRQRDTPAAGATADSCRIEVSLRRSSRVVLTAWAAGRQASVARAIERAARAVSRALESHRPAERHQPFAT